MLKKSKKILQKKIVWWSSSQSQNIFCFLTILKNKVPLIRGCLVCIFIFCFHFWKLFSFSKDLNSDNMLDLTSCLKLFLWGFCFQLKNIFTKNVILLFLFSGSVGKIFSLKMFSKIQSNTFPSLFFVFSENENKKQPKQTPPY